MTIKMAVLINDRLKLSCLTAPRTLPHICGAPGWREQAPTCSCSWGPGVVCGEGGGQHTCTKFVPMLADDAADT